MIIEVYGVGCSNCERVMKNAEDAVAALGIEAKVVKVEDFETLIRKGITKTPGLVIDGEVRSMGRVPSVEEIKEMLEQTGKETSTPQIVDTTASGSRCCGSAESTMLYSCAGSSNVGQMSNEVAKFLAVKGIGKLGCLAGVGAHGKGFVASAKNSDQVVVIDGCGQRCAAKTLRHAEIEPSISVVITELGMKKDHEHLYPSQDDVESLASLVETKFSKEARGCRKS